MNVEIGTEAPQFQEKEYINGIFVAVQSWTVLDTDIDHANFEVSVRIFDFLLRCKHRQE